MKFYNAKIRINGSLLHEVIKQRVTAPELLLLNAIHGGSAIVSVTECGSKDFAPRDHRLERRRLDEKYGQGGQKQKHIELLRSLFGPIAGALPEEVSMEDFTPDVEEPEDLDAPLPDEPAAAKVEKAPEDPKDALRASIEKLGGSAPKNASINRLRDILGNLQIQQGFKTEDSGESDEGSEEEQSEPVAETAGVL